ncbi:hypothetical protein AVEN_54714-1 [Araneus ventricosus]|uniref:Uncharacterized protein n=1 Tax=Araneus ventricosus TaxID=182803 RepID=A0A4Y2HCK8_ARAVE|nr:hypothetical protein AVEN_54714-1 [Araneus ventricosus]
MRTDGHTDFHSTYFIQNLKSMYSFDEKTTYKISSIWLTSLLSYRVHRPTNRHDAKIAFFGLREIKKVAILQNLVNKIFDDYNSFPLHTSYIITLFLLPKPTRLTQRVYPPGHREFADEKSPDKLDEKLPIITEPPEGVPKEEWMSIDKDIPIAVTVTDLEICRTVCEQDRAINVDDSDGDEGLEENPPTNAEMRQAHDILKRGVQHRSTN